MIKNQKGFTLIEVLMSLVLLSGMAATLIYVVDNNMNESRFQETVNELQEIKRALVGNPSSVENGLRKDFGYIGGVGGLPTLAQSLTALTTKPAAVAAWSVNTSVRIGLGWNGSYLQDGDSSSDYTKDAWGNDYVYSPLSNPPTITSLGADGLAGGAIFDQDIIISLPESVRVGNVYGFIANGNSPFTGTAEVELNYPNGSGTLLQVIDPVAPADVGSFQFSAIPYGIRSITVYVPSKSSPTTTIGPSVITVDQPNTLVNF